MYKCRYQGACIAHFLLSSARQSDSNKSEIPYPQFQLVQEPVFLLMFFCSISVDDMAEIRISCTQSITTRASQTPRGVRISIHRTFYQIRSILKGGAIPHLNMNYIVLLMVYIFWIVPPPLPPTTRRHYEYENLNERIVINSN